MPDAPIPASAALPTALGVLTLAGAALLLVCDASPRWFPHGAHDPLAAAPLATIALALVAHRAVRRGSMGDWARSGLAALAFLFWAANQVWPEPHGAIILNDLAIGAFVVDAFLAIAL